MSSEKHSKIMISMPGGLRHPMMLHGAGIATIAAACTSAGNALALSLIMLALCCGMAMVYIYERGEFIRPMLGVIYLVPAAFIACAAGIVVHWTSPGTAASLGMYLPLAAADSLVLARLQPDSPFLSPSDALPSAVSLWWLYAVMALPIGLLREILGSGTIFGFGFFIRINASGMNLPFAGFIMLGFGLAIYTRLSGEG
jgi:Predicted NADH:ubiquinone oxidoreductase, subunit RnfE